MVKVVGRRVFTARLNRMASPEMVEEVGKALFVGANRIQVSAQHSITDGSISGKGHIPSRPGEPPNADTHALDRQIEAERTGPLTAAVNSNDPKSAWLERGTSRMAARPFMLPALTRERKAIATLVKEAVNRVNKRPV